MIAYSTVAQLGYLLIALPLAGQGAGGAAAGALTAAVLLAASHAAARCWPPTGTTASPR
jgi:multicomponent Na+:H+ antiporter subunit D